jgi:hypothetical protein
MPGPDRDFASAFGSVKDRSFRFRDGNVPHANPTDVEYPRELLFLRTKEDFLSVCREPRPFDGRKFQVEVDGFALGQVIDCALGALRGKGFVRQQQAPAGRVEEVKTEAARPPTALQGARDLTERFCWK